MAEDSSCWWQINGNAHPQYDRERLRSDPDYCAQAALEVWQGAGWHAWSTYNNGAYLAFLDGELVTAAPAAPGPIAPVAGLIAPAAEASPGTARPWLVLGGVALALWAVGEL